ncbi:hypothetical protein [Streptomyces sp. NPDC058545]|uniref:hypothetical protein n=1 Tax=Streptomyces sp. NPDC058545 TaxID=3346544 RepID=UPI00365494D5
MCETHATTADNEAGAATGRLSGTLSATGLVQARERNHRPGFPARERRYSSTPP